MKHKNKMLNKFLKSQQSINLYNYSMLSWYLVRTTITQRVTYPATVISSLLSCLIRTKWVGLRRNSLLIIHHSPLNGTANRVDFILLTEMKVSIGFHKAAIVNICCQIWESRSRLRCKINVLVCSYHPPPFSIYENCLHQH